ncbi:MAG TPA: hypothetical protein VFB27_08505 [Opitutaceae bacterium]|nr:hypothetical protein [Opitutaceae bacterium]
MGQTHVHRYLWPLEEKKIDPTTVVTHRVSLSRAPPTYQMFAEKRDGCIKVVLDPAR